jgi:quinol monooxygenase YgiN
VNRPGVAAARSAAGASRTVIARYLARAGEERRVRALLVGLAEASRREPGNESYRVAQDIEDPRRFTIVERYVDADAFEAHRTSDHFRDIALAQVIPLLDDRRVEFFEQVAHA